MAQFDTSIVIMLCLLLKPRKNTSTDASSLLLQYDYLCASQRLLQINRCMGCGHGWFQSVPIVLKNSVGRSSEYD